MDAICQEFDSLSYLKQVGVYAEALVLERYELLNILKECIPAESMDRFLQRVDEYIIRFYDK
jgi:hypothetical protein